MKTYAIIQARMGSTRLPGKVLMNVNGKPLLQYQYERVIRSKVLDKVVVATSTSGKDDLLFEFCRTNNIECYRGSETDVLGRFYNCAVSLGLTDVDTIVRLTADCPLIDPGVIDSVVSCFYETKADYTGNTVPPEKSTFPDGTDVEVFSMRALQQANRDCKDVFDREHVTFYFWKYDNHFKTSIYQNKRDLSKYRFTVDYPEDIQVVTRIMDILAEQGKFGNVQEVIDIIDNNPNIRDLNSKYYFGIGWKKSTVQTDSSCD